mmetsp:Transcript_4496/g.4197  ORF Transcript_4496/g.4197 Transcript_4496/m.4197 type:complete len:119 (+) Transcript_4496:633-989(+)
MIMNTKLTVANIGDSSAFLVKNSNVIELTSDHNYSRLDEYSRVTSQNLGEFLILKNRLNGQLALSRSIGDLKYRPAVTSEAETQTITLSSLDQYLILTSDGVWSKKFSKRDAINYINT